MTDTITCTKQVILSLASNQQRSKVWDAELQKETHGVTEGRKGAAN